MMDAVLDTTRGFERNDAGWHCHLDLADSVDEVLEHVRDYIATLAPQLLARLPESCRYLRVKAEDDIEYWTCKLSHRAPSREPLVDEDLLQDVFDHFLHASLRISHIRRIAAEAIPAIH